ncbi:MAG: EAL domain-containing protein [Spirochaetaceae bacterium]|nr:EAL domain-containing protein [Spirochaetaceae bacterium]
MDKKLLYNKKSRHFIIPLVIAFFAILISIFVFYGIYLKSINSIFADSNTKQISEYSSQAVTIVEERLKNNFSALEQLSSVFYDSENLFSDTVVTYMKKKVEDFNSLRLDIILPNGEAIVFEKNGNVRTDINLGIRDYFKTSMTGKNAVEFLESSLVDQQQVFICSVPIYYHDKISGVLLGAYDTASLEEMIVKNGPNDTDFSFMVTKEGRLITGKEHEALQTIDSNFFNALTEKNFLSKEAYESFFNNINTRKKGFSSITLGNDSFYFAYNPLSFNECYLFTMIPTTAFTFAIKHFNLLTSILCIIEVIFFVFLAVFFLLVFRKNRNDLYDLAFKDSITGGGNNAWFQYEAEKILKNNPNEQYALVMLDIDNLKLLNDTYGYEAGNHVLEYVYNFIINILVSNEIAARSMQDDFIMLLKHHSDEVLKERLDMLASKLNTYNMAAIGTNKKYVISISVGIYQIEDSTMDMLSMQDRTYMALNCAKKMQGSLMRYAFFHEQDRLRLHEEKRIENRMEEALANNEFVVYVQPKYNIYTNQVSGAEALVRWLDPSRGMVPPDRFIPLFERNGFIFKIDLYVFEQVCKMLRSELDKGLEPYTVSVNLSRAYLTRKGFLDEFKAICLRYNIPPKYLELELTETIVFENMNLLLNVIQEMHDFGFTCSLDDFGSGYSSLNILKSVPVDVLKLDKEFFSDPDKAEPRGTSVIESVIELAQKLKMKTVSEGVEQEWQVDLLRKAKCDMVQGYIYSKPVPISDYEKLAFSSKQVI